MDVVLLFLMAYPLGMTERTEMPECCEGGRLRYLPIPLFGSVMGLVGLTVAWARYDEFLGGSAGVSGPMLWAVTGWFAFLTLVYSAKAFLHFDSVVEEFRHPVRSNFFPAFSICLLLLSIAWLNTAPEAAKILWWIGTPLHLVFTLIALSNWLDNKVKIQTLNPAWFIPVVGNILVPVAGVKIADPDVSWFFFSIGLIYWVALFTIVLYRLIFHDPLPAKLKPTLFILVAPPAVAFIAWVKLTAAEMGQPTIDSVGRILYFFGMFTLLLLFFRIRPRKSTFFVSWWAYTFPMAAATLATILMAHVSSVDFYHHLAIGLLYTTTLVNLIVLMATIRSAVKGEVCVPE